MISKIKYELTRQRHVREIFLLYLIILSLFFATIYTSLAIFEKQETVKNVAVVKGGNLNVNITSTSANYNVTTGEIITSAKAREKFDITITNNTATNIRYKLYYQVISPTPVPEEYKIGVIESSSDTGTLGKVGSALDVSKTITMGIVNDSTSDVTVKIWFDVGYGHNDITLASDKLALTQINYPKTLADVILENNPVNETKPNFETIADTDEGLFKDVDDDGDTYYFRGAVEDNYVSFANMMWRIVRINGDGTVRLIANSSVGNSTFNDIFDSEEYVGYTYNNGKTCNATSPCNSNTGTPSIIKTFLDKWYSENLASTTDTTKNFDDFIATTRYCNDTSVASTTDEEINYGAKDRLQTNKMPQFTCPDTGKTYGGSYNLKVGLLSADEAWYAGGTSSENANYYLYRGTLYWLASPCGFNPLGANEFRVPLSGGVIENDISNGIDVVPVINLRTDILYASGDGTETKPYEVSAS